MIEAIRLVEEASGKSLSIRFSDEARIGDHMWWVSDVRRFRSDYPEWEYEYDLKRIVDELVDALRESGSARNPSRTGRRARRRGSRGRQGSEARFGPPVL